MSIFAQANIKHARPSFFAAVPSHIRLQHSQNHSKAKVQLLLQTDMALRLLQGQWPSQAWCPCKSAFTSQPSASWQVKTYTGLASPYLLLYAIQWVSCPCAHFFVRLMPLGIWHGMMWKNKCVHRQLFKVLKTTRARVTHQSLGSLWEQLLSEEIQHNTLGKEYSRFAAATISM